MRILIIGAGGLIGGALARLIATEAPGASALLLADRAAMMPPAGARIPIECRVGDFCDAPFTAGLLREADCVFHLASLLATETEADPRRGEAVNLVGLMQLLELCTALPRPPRLVYTSSIAAFGGPLPETVGDDVAHTPRTTYGTHKAIAELLIDDASRRGTVDGRVLRLPIVLVRNGPPSTVVSDRVAALVREPLLGRDIACALHPQTRMVVASARRVADALWRLAQANAAALGHTRAMNLPSLSLTAAELAAAVQRSPVQPKGRITWAPDPALRAVMESWPRRFTSPRASALGLQPDRSADEIVAGFVADAGLG